nr:MAG TPA: hypothetical protein [Caudoviricetes sp.]
MIWHKRSGGGQECPPPLFIYKNNPILFWNIQNDVVDL